MQKNEFTSLELLAPAGNLSIGVDAINAGADAVYIGAPKFGARANAGVAIEDIKELADYAHLFGAKVYVALNTIIYDIELQEVEKTIHKIYHSGVDALIIQDLGILRLDIPPIALHASTQCHNNDSTTLRRLEALGFEQAVLARELNIEETARINNDLSTLKTETFIHGALCVCYSGRCYLSQAFTNRSANRGNCAQVCRLPYTLLDAKGRIISKDEHLLSLKDLNRSHLLPALINSGVSSFKIEGRLKNAAYVKNITAYYRCLLDEFIALNSTRYHRASIGYEKRNFIPNPHKSFSRDFTTYQLKRGTTNEKLIRTESPKSEGEILCRVQAVKGNKVSLERICDLHNGDGVSFYLKGKQFGGRVNKVIDPRTFIFIGDILPRKGGVLYRNYDLLFDKQLQQKDAVLRSINIELSLTVSSNKIRLSATLEQCPSLRISVEKAATLTFAEKEQPINRIRETLSKFGNTIFSVTNITIDAHPFFIPLSLLGELRRELSKKIELALQDFFSARPKYRPTIEDTKQILEKDLLFPQSIDYQYNVSNQKSAEVYRLLGAQEIAPAYELSPSREGALMITKHCILRHLGYCRLENNTAPFTFPLFLLKGKEYLRLQFDCQQCEMRLYAHRPISPLTK